MNLYHCCAIIGCILSFYLEFKQILQVLSPLMKWASALRPQPNPMPLAIISLRIGFHLATSHHSLRNLLQTCVAITNIVMSELPIQSKLRSAISHFGIALSSRFCSFCHGNAWKNYRKNTGNVLSAMITLFLIIALWLHLNFKTSSEGNISNFSWHPITLLVLWKHTVHHGWKQQLSTIQARNKTDQRVAFFTHNNEVVAAGVEFARKKLLTKDSTNVYEQEKSHGEGYKRIKSLL